MWNHMLEHRTPAPSERKARGDVGYYDMMQKVERKVPLVQF